MIVHLGGVVPLIDELEDRGADQDPISLLEASLLHLLPVDERAVGRAEILDGDLPAG